MQKPSSLLQIVIACSITILAVSAIASATTTIGTNISTGGTLAVTGVSTMTGQLNFVNASSTGWIKSATINSDTGAISFGNENLSTTGTLTMGGIATSTSALVASSTLRVFGTTAEGTGTFIETIANGTDVLGLTDTNGINFKRSNGTIWGTIGRLNAGGYYNTLFLEKATGDTGAMISIVDASGNDLITLSTAEGLIFGTDSGDNASSSDIRIKDGSGGQRFIVDGATGNGFLSGNLAVGSTLSIAPNHGQLVAASTTAAQLALLYDASNYGVFTANSSGNLQIGTTGGEIFTADNLGVSTTSAWADLSVGDGIGSATTTIDFSKPCFKMLDSAGNTIYYYPCTGNDCTTPGAAWATSTTSCY